MKNDNTLETYKKLDAVDIIQFIINYKMLPEEVINATTLNSAYAMGVEEEAGSIAVGKLANFYITTPISGIEYLPYAYTADLIEAIFLKGEQY